MNIGIKVLFIYQFQLNLFIFVDYDDQKLFYGVLWMGIIGGIATLFFINFSLGLKLSDARDRLSLMSKVYN